MNVTLFAVATGLQLVANDPNGVVTTSTQSTAFSVDYGTVAAMTIATISDPVEAGDPVTVYVHITSDTFGNAGIPLSRYSGAVVSLSGATGFEPSTSTADGTVGAQAPNYSAAQTWGGAIVNIATFTINLKQVETGRRVAATEVGSTGKIASATSNSFAVTHCDPHHLHLAVPANAVAGTAFNATMTVHDPHNNVVTGASGTFAWQATPASGSTVPVTGAPTLGIITDSVTLVTVGVSSVNVYAVASPTLSSTATVTVGFSGAYFLNLAVSTNQVAGTPFGSTVTVVDSFNNQVTTYTGTVTFFSGDSQFVTPVVSTTAPGGQRLVSGFILKTAGNQTFSASDNAGSTSTSTVIAVALEASRRLNLVMSASATSGQDLSPTIRMVDVFNNIDTASTATVRLTSSDGAATLPPDTALVSGQKTVSLILRTAGNQTVTAVDVSTPSVGISTTNTVAVSAPTAPVAFGFTLPATVSAGQAFTFSIESRDQFGNKTNYTGPGTLSLAAGRFEIVSENGAAVRAAPGLASATGSTTINFVNGTWTGQVVLRGEVARPNFTVSVNGVSGSTAEAGIVVSNDLPYMTETIVYPNPYKPAVHGDLNIRFHDPSGASQVRIVIYTFDWQKVREWNLDSSTMGADVLKRLVWDGKDESGTDVAPGVYLCVTEVGGADKRSKLAVIR